MTVFLTKQDYRDYVIESVNELEDIYGSIAEAPENDRIIRDLRETFLEMGEHDDYMLDQNIKRMLKSGMEISEISARLGYASSYIYKKVKKVGE